MEQFWFVTNPIDRLVHVVFRNINYDVVNVFFHMLPVSRLMELEEIAAKGGDISVHGEQWVVFGRKDTVFVKLGYDDCAPGVALNRHLFLDALSGYLEECRKLGICWDQESAVPKGIDSCMQTIIGSASKHQNSNKPQS